MIKKIKTNFNKFRSEHRRGASFYKFPLIFCFITAGVLLSVNSVSAATEFVSTIRATGGDYSMLSTWEAAVQSNLTASTTVVYSGTGAGGISAGATLELFRGGEYQNITALKVATTSSQLLVQTFTGSYKVLQNNDQWRVASSTDNMWTVSSAGLGDSAIAIAQIDGAWTSADTTAVSINGWTTSATNYIKVYTTESARHNGKWDEGKYRLEVNGNVIIQLEYYVIIEGLQIKTISATGDGIDSQLNGWQSYSRYSHNIIWSNNNSNGNGISAYGSSYVKIWNNIIYGFTNGNCINLFSWANNLNLAYNNTVYECNKGIASHDTYTQTAKNNIAQNCVDGFYGAFNAPSDYNLSDLAGDAPGANSKNSTNVAFVDEANDDFHLAGNDSAARNAGTDLSADANLPFSDDIDGQTRTGTWDIGADEAAENIYRSVGPSKTTALVSGASYGALTVSGSTATFAAGLPDEVGVGDALQYDDDGDGDIDANDSIVFIHSRTNSTTYEVKTASGAVPTAVVDDADWSLFRAYISLANAETGTENTGIDADLRNFDTWTLGKDISSSTGSNEQWNIACYANGTTADTSSVTINGWTTTADNYIKIYTPTASSEVGASQRHSGKWDEGAYRLTITSNTAITITEENVRIEGLQIHVTATDIRNAFAINPSGVADVRISHNIAYRTSSTGSGIINTSGTANSVLKVWNNIFYDYNTGIYGNSANYTYYIYNNTIYGCSNRGYYRAAGGTFIIKNNIAQNCADGFNGNFSAGSDYNISDIAGDTTGISPSYRNGLATVVVFTDEANDDFHLAPNDYSAINAGTNLSADSYLPFTDDIDGETRPISTGWDIGADESYLTKFKLNNGTFKIKGKAIFR